MTSENLQDVVNEAQVFQIQQQILAYKTLIRSTNIPKDVEKNIFALSKDQWEVEKERLLQRTIKYYHEKVEKNDELKKLISRYNDKKPTQNNMNEELSAPSQDQEKDGADDKEDEGNYLINQRKKEIKHFMSSGCLTSTAKSKLNTEAKFLETVPFYYELRDTIMRKLMENDPSKTLERSLLERRKFTRERPARKHEHKMMEKFENQMKTEQEIKKKIRQKEFTSMIFEHQERFFEFHKKVGKIMKKRGIGVKNYIEMMEKRGKNLNYLEYSYNEL